MAIDLPDHIPGQTPGHITDGGPVTAPDETLISQGGGESGQRPNPHPLAGALIILEMVQRRQRRVRVLRIIGLAVYVLALFGIYGLLAFFGLLPTMVDY